MTPTLFHELPEWAADRLSTYVEVHLDWRDRLRVLFGRLLRVEVQTDVEHDIGRYQSSSSVRVDRFVPPWTSRGGYAEVAPTEPA